VTPTNPSTVHATVRGACPPGLQGEFAASSGIRRAETLADLCAIFEPQVQVCVHSRPAPANLAPTLDAAGLDAWAGVRTVLRLGRDGPSGLSDLALPVLADGGAALLGELAFLTELYGELLGCPAVGLRVECLDRAMCPRWHVDRTGIRLLCTLSGPGTEWLDDAVVDRAALRDGAAELAPGGRAAPFDIVLLKGSAWQGNAERGAIHRSPAVPPGSGPRLLVALDALWND
jgi:hypothetical protein